MQPTQAQKYCITDVVKDEARAFASVCRDGTSNNLTLCAGFRAKAGLVRKQLIVAVLESHHVPHIKSSVSYLDVLYKPLPCSVVEAPILSQEQLFSPLPHNHFDKSLEPPYPNTR